LVKEPELRYTPNGVPVATFTLAVDRPFTSQSGQRETDFIDIVTWRKLAENCAQHLSKGRLVAIEGRLQVRSYQTQDGQKRRAAEVVADNFHFLDRPKESAPAPAPSTGSADDIGDEVKVSEDDIPF
jgi:single-strand DNA-binding protein